MRYGQNIRPHVENDYEPRHLRRQKPGDRLGSAGRKTMDHTISQIKIVLARGKRFMELVLPVLKNEKLIDALGKVVVEGCDRDVQLAEIGSESHESGNLEFRGFR